MQGSEFTDEYLKELREGYAEIKKKIYTKDGKRKQHISQEVLDKEKEYIEIGKKWEAKRKPRESVSIEKRKAESVQELKDKGLEVGDTYITV